MMIRVPRCARVAAGLKGRIGYRQPQEREAVELQEHDDQQERLSSARCVFSAVKQENAANNNFQRVLAFAFHGTL